MLIRRLRSPLRPSGQRRWFAIRCSTSRIRWGCWWLKWSPVTIRACADAERWNFLAAATSARFHSSARRILGRPTRRWIRRQRSGRIRRPATARRTPAIPRQGAEGFRIKKRKFLERNPFQAWSCPCNCQRHVRKGGLPAVPRVQRSYWNCALHKNARLLPRWFHSNGMPYQSLPSHQMPR